MKRNQQTKKQTEILAHKEKQKLYAMVQEQDQEEEEETENLKR